MAFDPRVDAYIKRAAPFAQPILVHLRALVHEVAPGVEETIKWGMPTFMHAGTILCSMAAFKQHASFGLWKHALVTGGGQPPGGMGSYGKLAALADLPPRATLVAHLRKALALAEAGPSASTRRVTPKAVPAVPPDLAAALAANPAAGAAFEAFPPGARREYIEWIVEAKREDTRARRLAQAIEWIAEGKRRNWKYAGC